MAVIQDVKVAMLLFLSIVDSVSPHSYRRCRSWISLKEVSCQGDVTRTRG